MHPIDQALARSGGFLRRRDLLALGLNDDAIRRQLSAGGLIRIRHGWYAHPGSIPSEIPDATRAVRVGGRLTGMAALSTYGVWVRESPSFEVAVPRSAHGLRSPERMRVALAECPVGRGVRIHWDDEPIDVTSCVWRVGVMAALRAAVSQASLEDAVIVIDSCLHEKLIRESDLPALRDSLPERCARAVELADGRAASGGETAVRLRMRELGMRFDPQPKLPGVGSLDGRIGTRTFIEVDGFAAHSSPKAFELDHSRDLLADIWKQQVVRMTSQQVFSEWPLCLAAILTALEDD